MLGKGHAVLLRRAELKTFVNFHGNEVCQSTWACSHGHQLNELICLDLSALKEYYPYFVCSDFPLTPFKFI